MFTYFCKALSSTLTMNSLFDGMSFKTSALSRRSMWGPRISCNFLICNERNGNNSVSYISSIHKQIHLIN